MRSGYYLGVAAPLDAAAAKQLWVVKGRLMKGTDPIVARPYEDHDYFVIEIEHRSERDDWAGLHGIAELNEQFATVMADRTSDADTKRQRLGQLWPAFQQALQGSPELTDPDRARIAGNVQQDLAGRLEAMAAGNPFVTRDVSDGLPPSEFDFVDVQRFVDLTNEADASRARVALTGNFD